MSQYSIQNFILLFLTTVFFTLMMFAIDCSIDGLWAFVSVAYIAGLIFVGFATALIFRIWEGQK